MIRALFFNCLLGFSLAFSSSPVAAERGGTLTVGMYAEFAGFNLAKVKAIPPNTMAPATAIMEGLFAYDYDQNYKIVPRLGVSFDEAPDRLSAVVKLRSGVKFHDGTPFDADAVVYHFSRLLDPSLGLGLADRVLRSLARVEAIDALTVRFVLKQPWPSLQSTLALDDQMNLIGSPQALRADPEGFNRKPVGTGPFAIREWKPGDRLVVERNPDYWDPAVPYVDRVVYRILPDSNTRYQSLLAGELDVIWTDTINQVLEARNNPRLKVFENVGRTSYGWIFNHSKKPLNDVRVRAAVAHAFDAAALVDGYFQGAATAAREFFPNTPWSCPGLRWRSFDLDRAKALVSSVGEPISVTVTTWPTPTGRRLTSILQQFLEAAGIKTQIDFIEPSRAGARAASGDFEIQQWRFADVGGEPDLVFGSISFSATRYRSEKADQLLASAKDFSDPEKRRQIYCELSQLLVDDAVVLLPEFANDYLIANQTVKAIPRNQANLIRVRGVHLVK